MSFDFNKPVPTDTYLAVLSTIRDGFVAAAQHFSVSGSATNYPDKAIRYNESSQRWERFSSTTTNWTSLPLAITADTLTVPLISTVAGGGTGTGFVVESLVPGFAWKQTDASLNSKLWDVTAFSSSLHFRVLTDDGATGVDWFTANRTGLVVSASFSVDVNLGQNTSLPGDTSRLQFYNTTGGGTPFAASLRLSKTNLALEIVNSAYSAVNASFYDSGLFAARASISGQFYSVQGSVSATPAALFTVDGYGGLGGRLWAVGPTGTYGKTLFLQSQGGSSSSVTTHEIGTDAILRGFSDFAFVTVRSTAAPARSMWQNSVRAWSVGVSSIGQFLINDESAPATRMLFATDGTVTIPSNLVVYGSTALAAVTATSLFMSGTGIAGTALAQSFDASSTGALEARGDGTNAAVITFHRPSAFGIKMGLDTSNNFLIGGFSQGASTYRVYWDPSGNQVTTGNVFAFSDIRFKTDFKPIENILEKLDQIEAFTYTDIETGERRIGVSAQSVKTVFPEGVQGDEHLSVAYGNVALASTVMLSREVLTLRGKVARLEARGRKLL